MPSVEFPLAPRQSKQGHNCPRPEFEIDILTANGYRTFLAILDLGSDVTIVSADLARGHNIRFDQDSWTDSGPTTLTGQMQGYEGTIDIRFLKKHRPLPCFFQSDPDSPSAPAAGPTWVRRQERVPQSLAKWQDLALEKPEVRDSRSVILLGRAGFFETFSVVIQRGKLHVSTNPFTPLKTRP